MKNKGAFVFSIVIALCAISPSLFSAENSEPDQALASPAEVKRTATSLDELLSPAAKKVVFDGNGHSYKVKAKPVDPRTFVPILADIARTDRQTVSRALSQRYHLSDIVFAGLLAGQHGQGFKQTLKQKSPEQWIKDLEKAQVPLQEAQDQLDIAYVELAFVALDRFDEDSVVKATLKD
jgi:hypothetical protein